MLPYSLLTGRFSRKTTILLWFFCAFQSSLAITSRYVCFQFSWTNVHGIRNITIFCGFLSRNQQLRQRVALPCLRHGMSQYISLHTDCRMFASCPTRHRLATEEATVHVQASQSRGRTFAFSACSAHHWAFFAKIASAVSVHSCRHAGNS